MRRFYFSVHDRWSAGQPLTTAEARAAGYEVVRGAYRGTTDDRLDRWYIELIDARIISRLGSGYSTRADALWALTERLAANEATDSQIDRRDVARHPTSPWVTRALARELPVKEYAR